MHLDRVATHTELAPHQIHVVALVLDVHEFAENGSLVVGLPDPHHEQLVGVLQRRTEAVDG